ncbi:soluble NSF attachment protein [Cladochytrium replicatum]|nr:soluble NSF attachment protein [Cladochytrium replicatum]
MDSKVREGMELMAAGEKALSKKSFFGGKKPDYDDAVHLFEQAAIIFKNGRAYDQAVEAHIKAADCHKNLDSLFLAAKQLESAANISVQQTRRLDEAADLYRRTSDYFLAHGSPDRAAEMLEKAAKAMEPVNLDAAIQLYDDACSTYEAEEKLRFGLDTFKRYIALLIRSKRYAKAVEVSLRLVDANLKIENRSGFNRQGLATVIITLLVGDEVAAGKHFASFASVNGFVDSEDGRTAAELLKAFDSRDSGLLEETLKRSSIQFLDNEVARAAMTLKIASGGMFNNAVGLGVANDDDALL